MATTTPKIAVGLCPRCRHPLDGHIDASQSLDCEVCECSVERSVEPLFLDTTWAEAIETDRCRGCGGTEVEHRWMTDMVIMRNLDEWKCNDCGLRWAKHSDPLA